MIAPFAFLKQAAGGFDPATLALTGFFVSYAGSPWNGTPSAGTSGGESMSEGTNAPTASGGAASFDGTNDLMTGDALADYLDADGWGIHLRVLLKSGQPADPGNGNRYTLGAILVDSDAYFGIFPHASGISVECADGISAASTLTIACGTGSFKTVQIRYNHAGNGKLQIRIDGGAWSEETYGAIGSLAGLLKMGTNYSSAAFAAIEVAGCLISDYVPDDAECDDIKTYLDAL